MPGPKLGQVGLVEHVTLGPAVMPGPKRAIFFGWRAMAVTA
jgi:hypothetical protein